MHKPRHIIIPRLALGRSELALSIGVSTGSIDVMVAEGVLPPPRRWHTRKLWIVSEVEAFLNDWPTEGSPKISHINEPVERREAGQSEWIWRATPTLSPTPNQRERRALSELLAYDDGVWVQRSKVHCGIDTQERLEERGYIQIRNKVKFPDRVDSYMLTAEGRKAARELAG